MLEVCVPAASVTDTVAVFVPVVWVVSGEKLTVTIQDVPGARVVNPSVWPLPAGPQVDIPRRIVNSVAFVPVSAPWAIPVSVTLPVLVSVNTCVGHAPVPVGGHPRSADGLHVAGASVAA